MDTSLPDRFPITSNNANKTLTQIHTVTNSFSGINPAYIGKMTETIFKRPITWVGTLEAPTDTVLVKQIIGKNGLHLKSFTTKCHVDLIWHDRITNTFMVWGNKKCIISALYFIKRQITRFTLRKKEEEEKIECIMENMMSLDVKINLPRYREAEETLMEEPERKRMKYGDE
jgi:hypothetical protein